MAHRKCKKCGRFGHFAKTCKNTTRVVSREVPIGPVGNMGVTSAMVGENELPEEEQLEGTIGGAVGASEFAADLNPPPEQEEAVYQGEVVEKEPSGEKEPEQPAPPTPARVMFQQSMNTLFTFWGAALDNYAGSKVSPPEEIKLLCCMAWTDVADAMGWLEHADDPTVAALLATGLTGGTYGVATYQVIQAKRKRAQ